MKLKEFQVKAAQKIFEKTFSTINNSTINKIILQAPTGSGKTLILFEYIKQFISNTDNYIFIWLTPGKGELEVQSFNKMRKSFPAMISGDLDDVLLNGFENKGIYFINWEKITNKTNIAIAQTEKNNFFDRINEAKLKNYNFIVIIDEEHNNNTIKANFIIESISPKSEIRVSATPIKKSNNYQEIIISESDVIEEGLITKGIFINKDLEKNKGNNISFETKYLIENSNQIRKNIITEYQKINLDINPLVLIQFPNLNDNLISQVEEILNNLGFNYENGKVASWFSERDLETEGTKKIKKLSKINLVPDEIVKNNNEVSFLLFKQAIATGWDCPRAKILVKLRDNMSEKFEIQTLGRIRRMPEAHHYNNEILDYSYLFTYDEKFKNEAILLGGFEAEKLFLREGAKDITLLKQIPNKNYAYNENKTLLEEIREYFLIKYNLKINEFEKNKEILKQNGFIINEKIITSFLQGKINNLQENPFENVSEHTNEVDVSTSDHGRILMKSIDQLKNHLNLSYEDLKETILHKLFKKSSLFRLKSKKDKKILSLNNKEFYSFIINNFEKLLEIFKRFEETKILQNSLLEVKEVEFKIPKEEYYSFINYEKENKILTTNVYKNYSLAMIDSEKLRSRAEMNFEIWCENNQNFIKDVYRVGNKGYSNFSIIYYNSFHKQKFLHIDYIIRTQNKNIYLIKIEKDNFNKEEDLKAMFNQLKKYCLKNKYNFAFIKEKQYKNDFKFFINNTIYSSDINDESWIEIEKMIEKNR
ncbi:DEAD/DEAH box helicase family protein [Mycoplasma sp. 1012]